VSPAFDVLPACAKPPKRIVSLVPSITESLFALGLAGRVVGVTDWCRHPAAGVARLPKVGGTKDPDVPAVAALAPDLVLANHEENTRRAVDRLVACGLDVWVTYPRTVREGALLLAGLARLGATEAATRAVADPVLRVVEEAERATGALAPGVRPRVFCPIWRDPWMTAGPDTYVHDMIELCGGRNLSAGAPETSARARRYPKASRSQLVAAAPDVILLPDEPYAFSSSDARELARWEVPAARSGRIHLIDGTWVSWYGPRIGVAVPELRRLLQSPA